MSEPTPRGPQRATSTGARYLSVLSHAFKVAVKEWGWMDSNPVEKVFRPKERPGRDRFLEKDEVEKLLEKADLLPSGKAWEILQNLPSELDDFTKSKVEEELGETQLSAAEGMLGGAENDANAKTILKLILSTLEDRTEENLAKWAAAMNSEQ